MVKIFPIKTNSKIKNITRIVKDWSTLEEQWVKGLALSLLWYGFDPWPGNFYTLRVQPRKKKQKRSSKVIQFKIDMEESTAFLYTSNNQFFKCQDRENPNCPTTSLLIFFFFFFFFFLPEAGSYSSNLTPRLRTSICRGGGPKKQKNKHWYTFYLVKRC